MNNKKINIFRWVFGLFFAISSIVYIKQSFITSLSCFLLTVLILPPLSEIPSLIIKKPIKRPIKLLISFVLVIIAAEFNPSSSVKGVSTNPKQVTPTIAISNTPVPTQEKIKPIEIPISILTPTDIQDPTATPIPTKKPVYEKPTSILKPTSVSVQINTNPIQTNSGYWTCNCSKTCDEMGCAEAQYQLNTCGCSRRDADHDGTACDTQCQ